MKRDPSVYINDALECIKKIEEYLVGVTKDEFYADTEKQDAVMRRLEIIGEAIKKIPEETKLEYNNIEWRKIAGLRDVLIHEYFGVEIERVWQVIENDLPELKLQLSKLSLTT